MAAGRLDLLVEVEAEGVGLPVVAGKDWEGEEVDWWVDFRLPRLLGLVVVENEGRDWEGANGGSDSVLRETLRRFRVDVISASASISSCSAGSATSITPLERSALSGWSPSAFRFRVHSGLDG
jgi:hypothetical protein